MNGFDRVTFTVDFSRASRELRNQCIWYVAFVGICALLYFVARSRCSAGGFASAVLLLLVTVAFFGGINLAMFARWVRRQDPGDLFITVGPDAVEFSTKGFVQKCLFQDISKIVRVKKGLVLHVPKALGYENTTFIDTRHFDADKVSQAISAAFSAHQN